MLKWLRRIFTASDECVFPDKPVPARLTFDGETVRIFSRVAQIESFRWADVVSIHAYKQDCFGVDRIWVAFTTAQRADTFDVHEEAEGYDALIAQMQRRFPDYRPDWWHAVAFPAFAFNLTLIWSKPSAG